MVSKLYFIILLLFLSYCNCTMCGDVTSPDGPNSCKGLELKKEDTHCCYLRRKYHDKYGNSENFATCVGGIGSEWIKIMADMKEIKIELGFIIEEWDCQCFENSNYVSISILSIFLLFLLL